MFANCSLMGMDVAFPDTCVTPGTPPVPVTYPNFALGPMGVGAFPKVLYMGAPAHNLGTVVPLTNGDNLGVLLGVASATVMGPSRHLTGAFTVLVGGLPATRLTSISLQNSTNAPGARVVPSQTKVLMLAP
jgi:hypothetical protein